MRQFSAALLRRALGPVIAFLSSPCGRHSTFGRRRRSTRVRRYVSTVPDASAQVSAPPGHPGLPAPAPRLAPPSVPLPADEVPLVRPYFSAHERERARRPRAFVPAPRRPEPRCAPPTGEVEREFARVQARARALVREWAAAPAPSGDLLAGPSEWDELASLTRTWLDRRRQGVPA